MRSKTIGAVVLSSVLGSRPAVAQELVPQPHRPTLTVADFDTSRTGWMPPPHLGETLAELLIDRLVAAGPFRVIDRQWLVSSPDNKVSVPFDVVRDRAAGAGVEYLVVGSVTRLSIEKRSSTGGGIVPLPFVGGLLRKNKAESAIGLVLRVIDVRTGEVVATVTAESSASKGTSRGGGGIGVVAKAPILAAGGSSTSGVVDGLLAKAVDQVVSTAADKLLAAAPRFGAELAPGPSARK
jgi:curli biogenesis system outer membrane secretion channel CsgG